nr:hypothetical protein [uncultured Sphingorhabdus sp.]
MQHKLEYRAVWREARALFTAHSEAIVAIAGFFIFMSAWVTAYILPPLVFADLNDMPGSVRQISGYFENNWHILVPNMLVTMFGGLILYVLFAGRGLVKVGDALSGAAVLFLPYLAASIIVGWATFAGFLMFLVPGLYLTGRLALLPVVLTRQPELGVLGAIRQAWQTSRGNGWAILIVILFVALAVRVLSVIVMSIVAAITISVAGEGGVPIIEAAVTAIFATLEAVAYVLLMVAIHRQLALR